LGGNVHVGEQAFVGLGAMLCDGIRIAERSFIGTSRTLCKADRISIKALC